MTSDTTTMSSSDQSVASDGFPIIPVAIAGSVGGIVLVLLATVAISLYKRQRERELNQRQDVEEPEKPEVQPFIQPSPASSSLRSTMTSHSGTATPAGISYYSSTLVELHVLRSDRSGSKQ